MIKDCEIEYRFNIDNDINCFKAIPNNMEHIVIYCHNLTSDSTWALRFYEELLKNKIGVFSFDLPSHGNDNTDYKKFNLTLCLNYFNIVINYVKRTYPNVKINLLGSSFGSYLILNRLLRNIEHYNSVMLMSPCINIKDYFNKQFEINEEYFNEHDYKLIYGKTKIYKNTYLDFLNNSEFDNRVTRNNNVYIIHGEDDRIIDKENIKEFCNNLNIELTLVPNAPHEFYSYIKQLNKFIINKINNS